MRILYVGCHCDDIELMCGGTLYKHRDKDQYCHVLSKINPQGEKLDSICMDALAELGVSQVSFSDFPVRSFSEYRQAIWSDLKALEDRVSPDFVFVNADDGHQDHRVLFEESCRKVFNGTIVSYTFRPTIANNYFEVLDEETLDKKLSVLRHYTMYASKEYFRPVFIRSQAVVEGYRVGEQLAEGFHVKVVKNGLR